MSAITTTLVQINSDTDMDEKHQAFEKCNSLILPFYSHRNPNI